MLTRIARNSIGSAIARAGYVYTRRAMSVSPRLLEADGKSKQSVNVSPNVRDRGKVNSHKREPKRGKEKSTKVKMKNVKNKKVELTYEEESDQYLLRELRKCQQSFARENQRVEAIVQQFKDAFAMYGMSIVKAPICGVGTGGKDNGNFVHFVKEIEGEDASMDILLDCQCGEDRMGQEVQVLLSDSSKAQLVFFMGTFSKEEGFLFSSCSVIESKLIGDGDNNIARMRTAICSGENWVFRAMADRYEKQLLISRLDVAQFVSMALESQESDESEEMGDMPDLDGRLFVDAMLNYTLVNTIRGGPANSTGKLNRVIEMFSKYCDNANRGTWINELAAFIAGGNSSGNRSVKSLK